MTAPCRRAKTCWGLLLALVSWVGTPSAAHAQADPQQKAAAEALFDEGRLLLSQGQYESACRRFEQSQEIDPGVGTLLYLGDCYERSGRLASSWAIFREASSAALAAGQADRSRIADERARKLSTLLSKLVLLVPQEDRVSGFELLLDGRLLSSALFGVPFPVDPGQHELTARSPGRNTWSNIVELKANADYVNVQIPALAAAAPVPPTPYDAVAPSAAAPAVAPVTQTEPAANLDRGAGAPASTPPSRTPAYLVGGAGLVVIGVGVAFGLRASDQDERAKTGCPSGCLTQEAADLNARARSSALIANISYGVGVAALATGAYLFFTSGSSDSASVAAHTRAAQAGSAAAGFDLGVAWGAREGRVSVSGRF